MIRIQGKLDKDLYVAFSGGIDSIAVVNFLMKKHNVTLVFFHHGNELANKEYDFVKEFSEKNSLKLIVGHNTQEKLKSQSNEEFWRIQRYTFLNSLPYKIITCHHLDDCVETWVWSSMHGEGKLIPYENKNIYRPFLLTEKDQFSYWIEKHNLDWFEDTTNQENIYIRNYIRNELLPGVYKINPGLKKVIAKKLMEDFNDKKDRISNLLL